MTPWTTLTVLGTPAPQGSKRHVGKGRMVESSKAVKPWREAIVWQCNGYAKHQGMIRGPVEVDIVFTLARPLKVPKERMGYPSCPPDLDKLLRSTFDGLKAAGVIEDDARVIGVRAEKRYQDGREHNIGAVIKIRRCENNE